MEVGDLERLVDAQPRDVGLDGRWDVLRKALDVQVPQMMLDHPALLDAVGVPGEVDGHLHGDLLVPGDPQEVHVQELATDVVALDLAWHGQEVVVIDAEIDQDVHSGVGVEDVHEVAGIHGDVQGVDPVPVHHGGDAAGRPDLVRRTLTGGLAGFGLHLVFHGFLRRVRGIEAVGPAATHRLYRRRYG